MKGLNNLLRYTMYTMSILMGMTSCNRFGEEETIYARTVLVYMAAENTLASFYQDDIDEMMHAASDIPQDCRLLIYLDDYDLPRMLSIEKQQGRRPVCKTLHEFAEEHNSGDTKTLRLAMQWMTEHAPAESYGLVLWSHGDAWIPAKTASQRVVCQDARAGSWMEIPDIANALSAYPQLDFILFDACFMQSIEVAYELRHAARYIVASPAEIPAPGAPYDRILEPMFAHTGYAEGIAEQYYREYLDGRVPIKGHTPLTYGVCLSVVDCTQLEQLAATTRTMVTKYATHPHVANLDNVQRYYLRHSATRPAYYDINGYMTRLITNPADYALWRTTLDRTITHRATTKEWFSDYTGVERVDTINYSGLSCYVPKSANTQLNRKFSATSWYTAAGWQQAGW